jgi:hypothetical protein
MWAMREATADPLIGTRGLILGQHYSVKKAVSAGQLAQKAAWL